MRLHADEDIAAAVLIQSLRRAGHDVTHPAQVGLRGKADVLQLIYAIRNDRVVLSRNYCDFHNLHNLLMEGRGHHSGILVVRRDDDPKRNMSPRDIVRALANLVASGLPIADHYYELNPWQ